MSNFFKQGVAYVLLTSLLLESCSSPYMGIAKKAPMLEPAPTQSLVIDQTDDLPESLSRDTSLNQDNLVLIQSMDPLVSESSSLQTQGTDLFQSKDSSQQNETNLNIPALVQPIDRVVSKREPLQASLPNTRQEETAAKQPKNQAFSDKKPSFSRINGLSHQNQLRASQQEAKHNHRTNAASQVLEVATNGVDQLAPASQGRNAVVISKPEASKERAPQTFIAKGGHQVRFQQQASGQWEAEVEENLPAGISRRLLLPVYLEPGQSIATLGKHSVAWQKNNIHVVFHKPNSYVFVGVMGLLGGMMKEEEEAPQDESIPNECFCPITQEIMEDPVIAQDGHTYEKSAIKRWFDTGKRTSPKTGARLLSTELTPNYALRSLIQDLKARQPILARHQVNMDNLEAAIKLREEEIQQAIELKGNLLQPSPGEIIVFCGNPGVGKSSLCNSIFQKKVFDSGISLGTGMTRKKQEYIYENRKYIDTPGLSDISLRKQAAEEIEKALKENNNYKIIFVATLEAGRIKSDDLVTINTVCDAIKVPFEYAIIFNKLTKPVIEEINRLGLGRYLTTLNKQPLSTLIIKKDGDMEDANNVHLSSNSDDRTKLVNFITSLKSNMIFVENVQHIDVGAYQKQVQEMETKLAEALKKAEEEREKHKKEIADQAVKIDNISSQLQAVLTKEEERKAHQKFIEKENQRLAQEVRLTENARREAAELAARQSESIKKLQAKSLAMRKALLKPKASLSKGSKQLTSEVDIDALAIRAKKGDPQALQELLEAADQGDEDAQQNLGGMYYNGYGVKKDYKQAAAWYQKAADQGDADAQKSLGDMYYYGYGIKQDYKQAVAWYQKAADQGGAYAQNNLGDMYYNGYGVKQDYKQARAWYQKAADQRYADAQNNLGDMYYNGYRVKQDYKQARAWYQKAADQGNAAAQYNLGDMYDNGYGVKQDYKQAVAWYQKAADQGNAAAQKNLGDMYYYGYGVQQDSKQAIAWQQQAADQGYAAAQNSLGVMYKKGYGVQQDSKQAIAWYQKAAEQGDPKALFNLGLMYKKGNGVKQDYKQAIACYQKAAEQGYVRAQVKLGDMHYNGYGVKKDYKQAAACYQKGADQGDAAAQNSLGVMYDNGYGVKQDYKQAVAWYQKSADQGYAAAQNSLGVMYDNGEGVKQDYNQAVAWYQKAADKGDADAQKSLGDLYYNGYGVEQDYKQAAAWYQKAADQGYAHAQSNLGVMYCHGNGVKQDYKKAIAWYKKATDQGYAAAQKHLGDMYYYGYGVKQDYKQAVALYQKAADKGHADAQNSLGDMYYNGEGVKQDYNQAIAWYQKAAGQGDVDAQNNLDLMYKNGHGIKQGYNRGLKRKRSKEGFASSSESSESSESEE
jgi:hypothetical protein